MRDLSRDEARERAALLEVASYDVRLDLAGDDAWHFGSQVTVRFAAEPGRASFAELDGELLEATLNGDAAGPLVGNRLALPGLRADNELTVRARCTYSRTGEGLHRFVDPADGEVYLYAQSFLDDAQRIFACFDQPDLKASFRLHVDAPPDWTVIGNARAEQQQPPGRWSFAPTERISTYLFTVAAGPWHSVRSTHEGLELGLHCRRSLAAHLDADADELLEVTTRCLAFQQEAFGRRYPFGDTYDQLFVPEFNAGAMENPGAVTFSEDFVFRSRVTDDKRRRRAMVVAHEMSHMWFGDLVTMRWWDDLWLNESFAELMGYLSVDRATRYDGAWVDFSASRKAWGYRADQLPSTHPVQGNVTGNRSALLNFDGISYAKGASVLRQLMATVGEDTFFQGVRAYLDRHAFANTSFADLLVALEAASGRDLGAWAQAWLQTAGVSTLRAVVGETAVEIRQEGGVRPHRIGVGLYDRAGDQLIRRDRLDVEILGATTTLDLDPANRPVLLLPNDGDLTFAKLRFDDRSLAVLLRELHRLEDPLARALCWAALWDSCRDGELTAADFVDAVLAGVDSETDPAVVATLLDQARTAAMLYSHDSAALRTGLVLASRQAAWSAPAGSDLQLVRVKAFATVAPSDLAEVLRRLLDGDQVPAGLAVDIELRWSLVQALAVLGRVDEAAIDAELARDNTAKGRLRALTARASRPDPAAKARAWASATQDAALSNHERDAVAAGFWQFGQDELVRDYVHRYAAELPALWATRSPQVAGRLTVQLFPSTLVDPAVLDATADLLDAAHPAGLRRYVTEQRDDLARALRARGAEVRGSTAAGDRPHRR